MKFEYKLIIIDVWYQWNFVLKNSNKKIWKVKSKIFPWKNQVSNPQKWMALTIMMGTWKQILVRWKQKCLKNSVQSMKSVKYSRKIEKFESRLSPTALGDVGWVFQKERERPQQRAWNTTTANSEDAPAVPREASRSASLWCVFLWRKQKNKERIRKEEKKEVYTGPGERAYCLRYPVDSAFNAIMIYGPHYRAHNNSTLRYTN